MGSIGVGPTHRIDLVTPGVQDGVSPVLGSYFLGPQRAV